MLNSRAMNVNILFISVLVFNFDNEGLMVTNIIIYGSLGYCYFHFINLGETARRIRIMREIYESPTGLTKTEIAKKYNAPEMVEKRLSRLINTGQLIEINGQLKLGKKTVLFMANILTTLKIIFLSKSSEFQ
jgi:hypothetical protein